MTDKTIVYCPFCTRETDVSGCDSLRPINCAECGRINWLHHYYTEKPTIATAGELRAEQHKLRNEMELMQSRVDGALAEAEGKIKKIKEISEGTIGLANDAARRGNTGGDIGRYEYTLAVSLQMIAGILEEKDSGD